jgi:hypothetical protein
VAVVGNPTRPGTGIVDQPARRCHVLKCAHPEARAIWLKSVQDLARWMERKHTQLDQQAIIIENLRAWYGDQPQTAREFDWPGITEANLLQIDLGWGIFYSGFLIPDWVAIHQAYYDYLQKRNTGRRWASQLI